MREIYVSHIYNYISALAKEEKTKITNIWMFLTFSEKSKNNCETTLNIRIATRGFRDEDSTFEEASEYIRENVERQFNIKVGIVELVHSTIKEDMTATSMDQWYLLSRKYEYEKRNRLGKWKKAVVIAMKSNEKIHIWEKPGDGRSYIDGYKVDNSIAELMKVIMSYASPCCEC